jgi:alpha-glutamyl/putrescinyl thymine pyrophosphorylase clade 1
VQQIRVPATARRLAVTPAFDTYWRFAAERQMLYFRRLRGDAVWTTDPVLQCNRFTNVYRAADRVSQYLLSDVIPGSGHDPADLFFRVVLYKLFNRIETWRLLEVQVDHVSAAAFDEQRYANVLSSSMRSGEPIYSAAYIMPSPQFGYDRKHENHLALLRWMLDHRIPDRIMQSKSLRDSYSLLLQCRSLGPFLAFQLAIDLNYAGLTDFDEMSYVVAGPGAVDGIRKCFVDTGGLTSAEIIEVMAEIAPREFARLGLAFFTLWGRPLQLIDCQNLFCEVDKYCRAVHPELAGATGRTRIKQRYQGRRAPLPQPVFPSAWALDTTRLPEAPYARFAESA